MPDRESEQSQRDLSLSRWMETFAQLVALNAPDPILAAQVMLLFRWGMAYLREDMGKEMSRWMIENARREVARCPCPKCQNPTDIRRSHIPICEQCDARATAEIFHYEVDNPE